jgi:phosphatidylglycerophosphate synthase
MAEYRRIGSKIPREFENPLDNILIDIGCSFMPVFSFLRMTPNDLTTCSLISGLISMYYLWYGYTIYFAFFYMMSYYFDCIDGMYARVTNHCTQFGDLYDHIKDIGLCIVLSIIMVWKYSVLEHTWCIVTSIIIIFFTGVHIGLQENITKKNYQSESLSLLPKLTKFLRKIRKPTALVVGCSI